MSNQKFNQQITFLHASDLVKTKKFYEEVLGAKLVRDQGSCLIFQMVENAFLGFCEHIEPVEQGRKVILTLVSDDVDGWYDQLIRKGLEVIEPPKYNPLFQIYHLFLYDPNGYWIEIQKFDNPL